MTKRETAALAMRILAVYVLVCALLSVITLLLGLPALVGYVGSVVSKSNYLHPNIGLMVGSGSMPVAWELVLGILFWIWSPQLGRRIFAGPESDEEMGRLGRAGWISTFVLVLGVRLLILSLSGLGGGLALIGALGTAGFSSIGPRETLEVSRHFIGSLGNGLTGLFLLLGLWRAVSWIRIGREKPDTVNTDAALLGLRLLAIYSVFRALQNLIAMVSPQLISKSIRMEAIGTPSFDWRMVAIGVGATIISALPALLLWRLAPRIVGLVNRGYGNEDLMPAESAGHE